MKSSIDKNRVKQTVAAAKNAQIQLETISRKEAGHKEAVMKSYAALRNQCIQDILNQMPVEEINKDKSGIRIATLKAAGFHTIHQLAGISLQRLIAINGIGEDGARKIHQKVRDITESVQKSAKVKINIDNMSKDTADLLLHLAILLQTAQTSEKAKQLLAAFKDQINKESRLAKQLASSLRMFFSTKGKKDRCLQAYESLENLIQQGFARDCMTLEEAYKQCEEKTQYNTARQRFEENTAPFYAMLEQLLGKSTVENPAYHGLPEQLASEIAAFELDTSRLKASLRSYQTFGTKYMLYQKRTLLGDEMGLGKTVQAIAAMAHLAAKGRTHFLVVCPVSVMVNWTREIAQQSELLPVKIYGDNREEEFAQWEKQGGIAVTTFETVSRIEAEESLRIDMLVVDEAHYVKNPQAVRTKALSGIAKKAEFICFMTGTPIENKVEEMIFLLSMLNQEIARKTESMLSLSMAPEFRQTIAPVYLRRVREDVLTELPEKLEKEEWCIMTAAEEKAYKESLQGGSIMQIRQISWNAPKLSDSSKANRLLEICEDAKEAGRKVIVFSFFLDTIRKVQSLLGDACYGPIDGSVSANHRQEIVDEFSKGKAGSVLVSQIIAGGVGLNIQSASVVILCEPQWKPSTENQAISRVYRMGQSRSVLVHRLLIDESVDERILEILQGKSTLFDNFADESAMDTAFTDITEAQAMKVIIQSEREKYGVEAIAVNE